MILRPINLEYINPFYEKENENGNVADSENEPNAE